jgi:hypothetical protein
MQYEITIDDPVNYTAPWKVAYPLARDDQLSGVRIRVPRGQSRDRVDARGARAQEQRARCANDSRC